MAPQATQVSDGVFFSSGVSSSALYQVELATRANKKHKLTTKLPLCYCVCLSLSLFLSLANFPMATREKSN